MRKFFSPDGDAGYQQLLSRGKNLLFGKTFAETALK